ncbi:hypothetical protein GPL15_24105 [Clostridium sp. MCC353]|nr:hypothetical protein [Clostridium sp. MCC353]
MVWGFTLKGEGIFENDFALYVKFAFNYFGLRKPAGKRGGRMAGKKTGARNGGKQTLQGSCGNRLVELRFSAGKKAGRN